MDDKNKIKGGLADDKSVEDIAKKHNTTVDKINKEIEKGIKVEKEHTSDDEIAKEIAKDHAYENDKYYEKLKSIEETSTLKEIIKKHLKEEISSDVVDENTDTVTVLVKYNDLNVGVIKVTNANAKDTIEIVGLKFKPDYDSLSIVSQGVKSLWQIFQNKIAIIVAPEPEAIEFWNKIGFSRISKNYLILNRGH